MVGAGPVGLMLAAEVRRHAASCRIVDRAPAPTYKAVAQAMKFGAQISTPCEIAALDTQSERLAAVLVDGTRVSSKAVIIATGARYRRLALEDWERFEAAGTYYAATELEARGCAGYLVDRILADPRIEVRAATEITRLDGGHRLELVTLTHRPTGNEETRGCRGLSASSGQSRRPAGSLESPWIATTSSAPTYRSLQTTSTAPGPRSVDRRFRSRRAFPRCSPPATSATGR